MAQYKLVTCTINGKKREQIVDVRASLTDMIRNDFHLTSVKKGCEVGECGAFTVLIDGEAINSCLYLAVWAEGGSQKRPVRSAMTGCSRNWLPRKARSAVSASTGGTH